MHEKPTPDPPEPPEDVQSVDEGAASTARSVPAKVWAGLRWGVRVLLFVLVIGVAVAIVSGLTVDLGPGLKARAEQAASRLIERQLTIGRLSLRLLTGEFLLEDLTIAGLNAGDEPFLTADRIEVSLPWWTIVTRDLTVESVDMTGWRMVVETWEDGRHNFPRFTSGPRQEPEGPRLFTTTVQLVQATAGAFVYRDHEGMPWSIEAPNLDITVTKLAQYRGTGSFDDAVIRISEFEPMSAQMRCTFLVDGSQLTFDQIDLLTDGAESAITGTVDMSQWPEQTHEISSRVDFPRMRELFFSGSTFALHGEGTFDGTFHLFNGGHELNGRFASDEAGFNTMRFPGLDGALEWTSEHLIVSDATSRFYGGDLGLEYSLVPLGKPGTVARFGADYRDVDLEAFSQAIALDAIPLAGTATGHNVLEYPLGDFSGRHGEGEIRLTPPEGGVVQARALDETAVPRSSPAVFDRRPFREPVPVGGHLTYRFDPGGIDVAPSRIASPDTFIAFEGRTAYGRDSRIGFHVTSADWQESDRVLAGIMTAMGSPAGAVDIGGSGEFDGVFLGAFSDPHVEGRFIGRDMRAFGVTWGRADAAIVIDDAYAIVQEATLSRGDSRMQIDGRFSIGFPRADGGEPLDARFQLERWSLPELMDAFDLEEYPLDGRVSGDYHVYGAYRRPLGFGTLLVEEGVAWNEPFESFRAGLRLEGEGVRLDAIQVAKAGGSATGAAYVGFDGDYSFELDGTRLPIESVRTFAYPGLDLTGMLRFEAQGNGRFSDPRYGVSWAIDDLFLRDEGVGQASGDLRVLDDALLVDQLDIASPRVTLSGAGRIALTGDAVGEIALRFDDTSIDPFVRAFEPSLSPFTSMVASGTLRANGPFGDVDRLGATLDLEELGLRLFDYGLESAGVSTLALSGGIVRVPALRLVGEGTELELGGQLDITNDQAALTLDGSANLGVLQGFLRDVRSSGRAEVEAAITGPLASPRVEGQATIDDGRIRHFALPHSIDALEGTLVFDADGIHLDDLRGRMGGGDLEFGGRIGFDGLSPREFGVTARGSGMRLRYPEGLRSEVDADLSLRGDVAQPVLGGEVIVRDAEWVAVLDTTAAGWFGLSGEPEPVAVAAGVPAGSGIPLEFDLRITVPSTLRIDNNVAHLVSSADLTLTGTYDEPVLLGRAEIERGDVLFEGNRYLVTSGTIDFANPTAIDPFFDVEAETRVRVPGETYLVRFHISGTRDRFVFDLSSDPPLATVDILALLFGDVRDPANAELRALQSDVTGQELVAARAARLLASPIASGVGRAVEEAFGVDTVQITPSLGDLSARQASSLNPSARLTIGKRVTERMFLTYSRALSASEPDQIISLEFNQSNRLSWILSQNEDQSYALDVRMRRVF